MVVSAEVTTVGGLGSADRRLGLYARRWWILAVLCLSLLIVGIDGTTFALRALYASCGRRRRANCSGSLTRTRWCSRASCWLPAARNRYGRKPAFSSGS